MLGISAGKATKLKGISGTGHLKKSENSDKEQRGLDRFRENAGR